MEFRLKSTGSIISVNDLKKLFPNTSLPSPISDQTAELLNVDIIYSGNVPNYDSSTQKIGRDGIIEKDGIWYWNWVVQPYNDDELSGRLNSNKISAINSIDADVESIYKKNVGSKAMEYMKAEQQARAYLAAPTVTIPNYIESFATAAAISASDAAAQIIQKADAWTAQEQVIRQHRLSTKASIKSGTTLIEVANTLSSWKELVKTLD